MLAFVLPRYPRETLDALREARGAGLAVVAITDSPVSPAAEHADVVLPAAVGTQLVFDLHTAPDGDGDGAAAGDLRRRAGRHPAPAGGVRGVRRPPAAIFVELKENHDDDQIRAATRHHASPRAGWPQEAALRMLMNNLDPEVAERPDDLVVYGGTGKAARDWPSFHAIVRDADRRSPTTRPCWCSPAGRSACSAPTSGRRGC